MFVHPVVEEILEASRRRAASLETPLTGRVRARNIFKEIRRRERAGLVPVIGEVKPASPQRGVLREIQVGDAGVLAGEMERAGAVAISVLTEPEFFQGSLENLVEVRRAVKLPVLRKDFVVSELQLCEAESDLLLLIAGVLGEQLEEMVELAIRLGRVPLVEVHSEEELELALETPCVLLGINNRDFNTLEVDLGVTERLAPLVSDRVIVSESGITGVDDVLRVMDAGANAILVGSHLMTGEDVYTRTKELVEALK